MTLASCFALVYDELQARVLLVKSVTLREVCAYAQLHCSLRSSGSNKNKPPPSCTQKTLEFRGTPLKTSLWDIGGQSLSSSNLPNYLLSSHIIFLCYDTTDPQSFLDLKDWLDVIRSIYGEEEKKEKEDAKKENRRVKRIRKAEFYVVGNKIDLIEYRRVSEKEHTKFIEEESSEESEIKGGFFVSASSGENVLTTFYLVSAQTIGIQLTPYELEFTKKVLSVDKKSGGEESFMKGSEAIREEDEGAHEDVLNMLKGGGGDSRGGCEGCFIS